MSVTTITIKVDPATGAATVSTGVEPPSTAAVGEAATAEAPPPTLLGGPGGTAEAVATQELGAGAEGPPPLDPQELGLGVGMAAEAVAGGPPPEDLVEANDSGAVEAYEPMPIEDLEKAAKPTKGTEELNEEGNQGWDVFLAQAGLDLHAASDWPWLFAQALRCFLDAHRLRA